MEAKVTQIKIHCRLNGDELRWHSFHKVALAAVFVVVDAGNVVWTFCAVVVVVAGVVVDVDAVVVDADADAVVVDVADAWKS